MIEINKHLETLLSFDLTSILQIQAHAIFHLLCMGKTNSLFPVSVYSEFTLQALSIQHLSSRYPVFKITSNPPRASVSPSFSRQQIDTLTRNQT